MTIRSLCLAVVTVVGLLAAADSASVQPDECTRVRDARRQAENNLADLLDSLSKSEMLDQQGINPNYDLYPAAKARRQAQVRQMQRLILQTLERDQEVCAEPAPLRYQ